MTAILVIVLGLAMVLAGGGAIAYGNAYITLEQGWSAVISGSVMLTGGLVTMALGLAIQALHGLKRALVATGRVGEDAALRPAAPPETSAPRMLAASTLPALEDTARAEPQLGKEIAPSAREPVPETEPFYDEAPLADRVRDGEDTTPSLDPIVAPADDARSERTDFIETRSPFRRFTLRPRAGRGADIGRPAAPEPAASGHGDAEHAPANDPADDLRGTLALEPLAEDVPHDGATAHRGAPHEEAEPSPEAAAHGVTQEAPAVIGRYEAEGTTYTMYADGSIEAQSDAGVYRFNSMAELKAFIER